MSLEKPEASSLETPAASTLNTLDIVGLNAKALNLPSETTAASLPDTTIHGTIQVAGQDRVGGGMSGMIIIPKPLEKPVPVPKPGETVNPASGTMRPPGAAG